MENRIKKLGNLLQNIESVRNYKPVRESHTIKTFISADLNRMKIQIQDTECNNLTYIMTLEIDDELGSQYRILDHNLPSDVNFKSKHTAQGFVNELMSYIDRYSYYQNGLAFLDEYCCVVEPVKPEIRHNYRVIKFGPKVYMKVLIPAQILEVKDILVTFTGPNHLTEPLMKMYAKKSASSWDYTAGMLLNLKKIFGINCFLDQSAMSSEKSCAICLEYRDLDELAPIYTCDNMSCHEQFHLNCIQQWWESKKFMKIFHGVTKGECPACKNVFEVSF